METAATSASLHAACAADARDAMQSLITRGVDVDAVDENGETPLQVAIKHASVDVVACLVDSNASLACVDKWGNTLVHVATTREDPTMLRFLIENEVDVDIANSSGRTPLHVAVEKGSLAVIQCLVDDGGADLDTTDERNRSLLKVAIESDRADVVEYLIDKGADVEECDWIGQSLLHVAVDSASVRVAECLVEAGLDVNAVDENDRSLVHVAATKGKADMLTFLANNGTNLETKDAFHRTPLHLAVINDKLEAIKSLISSGADVRAVDDRDRNVLHRAVACASMEVIQLLETTDNDLHAVDQDGNTILHVAVERADVLILDYLLSKSVDPKVANNAKASLLHVAAQNGSLEMTTYLVSLGADVKATNEAGETPLSLAVKNANMDVVTCLVERGSDVNSVDKVGYSTLHSAVQARNEVAIRYLLDKGGDVNTATEDGITLLMTAVDCLDLKWVQYFVEAGAKINAVGMSGESALFKAAPLAGLDVLEYLVTSGADVNTRTMVGEAPLHIAAARSTVDTVNFLLNAKADPNAQDQMGKTALHVAANDGNVAMVESLLARGADSNLADSVGFTSLHTALTCVRPRTIDTMIRIMVTKGADVNTVAKNGKTPMHIACSMGEKFNDLVEFLLQNGAKESMRLEDADGHCPLHIAARDLNIPLVQILLDQGADVNLKNRAGRPPLHVATFNERLVGPGHFVQASMAYALCARGATWDITCDETLDQEDLAAETDEPWKVDLVVWHEGIKACVNVWEQERRDGMEMLTPMPIEIIQRGADAVNIYIGDFKKTGADLLVNRRKICVVGPSMWGKTSMIKSLTSMVPSLVQADNRTVGIDLFSSIFTEEPSGESAPRRHEVTFWDFAGQDVYQGAHTLFFSKRTLYLLCVDLAAYAVTLKTAETQSAREGEATIARFVAQNIFHWIRLIFVRQPDAEFVVVGTKADLVDDQRVLIQMWRDLKVRVGEWKNKFIAEIDESSRLTVEPKRKTSARSDAAPFLLGGQSARDSHLTELKKRARQVASRNFLLVSCTSVESVEKAQQDLKNVIISSNRSFTMTVTYSRVLEVLRMRREKAARMPNAKDRIENAVIPFRALCGMLMRQLDDLEHGTCVAVLRTLHDLGEILWYERDGPGALKDMVILDPSLVIDYVREVVNHEYASADQVQIEKEGCMTHAMLQTKPFWKDSDKELLLAFKSLLQYFQIAYPADHAPMDWDSDLIIPSYWKLRKASKPKSLRQQTPFLSLRGISTSAPLCWEYELSAEVSETLFEQFIVQSFTTLFKRKVSPRCIESSIRGDFASRIELIGDCPTRDVIRIEVAVQNENVGWQYVRFFVMAMEMVLDEYPGLVASRYVVADEKRHRVAVAVKALQDATKMGRSEDEVRAALPWLPLDLEWFIQKAWRRPGALQELRAQELVREAVDRTNVLRKLVAADEVQRQYPALWTLNYAAGGKKATLRMLSDLSGECFHEPIEIPIPPAFLANHDVSLQDGMWILSNVVPEVISLGIVQKAVEWASAAVRNRTEDAQTVHSMIEKLDLPASGVFSSVSSRKRLSPKASVALLRDLVKLHDASFDPLTISDISKLFCAATTNGQYVWASRQEIKDMGDKLMPCDGTEALSRLPSKMGSPEATAIAASPSQTSDKKSATFQLQLIIVGVDGLAEWDWRRAYCKWRVDYGEAGATIVSGETHQHSDNANSPSWAQVSFPLSGILSFDMLRECRLHVQLKRPSRCLGVVKLIDEGRISLDEYADLALETTDRGLLKVPLGKSGSGSTRFVKCQIGAAEVGKAA